MQLNANQRVDGSFCNHPGTSLKKPPSLPPSGTHNLQVTRGWFAEEDVVKEEKEGTPAAASGGKKKVPGQTSVCFFPPLSYFLADGRVQCQPSYLLFFGYFIFFYNSPLSSSSVTSFRGGFGYKTFFPPSSLYLDVYKYFSFGEINQRVVYTPAALQYL